MELIRKKRKEKEKSTNTQTKTPTKSKVTSKPKSNKEPETPVLKKYESSSPSLKNISIKTDSINDKEDKKIEERAESNEDRSSNPFTQESLEKVWIDFANSISNEMPRLYQVLKSNSPTLKEGFNIHLQVDNELQKKDIEDRVYSKISGWLKSKLDNYKIQLTVNVANLQQKKKMVYTATDKFNYLAEQNKNLLELKKNFGLDFE